MIEKIKNWKIIYMRKDKTRQRIVVVQVRDGLVYDYHGVILGFTKKQIIGWNIYSILRTFFNEYEIVDMYRMKKDEYVKLDAKKIEDIVRTPVSSTKKCFETARFKYV